jgi:beta-phosphoglucomutase-like phosphatase (HAD superfamily)
MTIETITTKAFLFDMDGTLIGGPRFQRATAELIPVADSTPAVLATWQVFAEKYDLDLTQVLKCE